MSTIAQLDPCIFVYTPMGRGRALLIIDYGMDINTCWVVHLIKSGQVKHFNSNDIRLQENYTFYIGKPEMPDDWIIE
jgi:hypothetical protein